VEVQALPTSPLPAMLPLDVEGVWFVAPPALGAVAELLLLPPTLPRKAARKEPAALKRPLASW